MLTYDNLTREQRRVHEFLHHGALLREMAGQVEGRGLRQLAGSVVEGLSFFIESELYYRQAERYRTVGVQAERAAVLDGAGERANARGMRAAERIFRAFEQLRTDVAELDPRRMDEDLDDYRTELRTALAESELKVKDVQRLDEALGECFDRLSAGGVAGLVDHLEGAGKQLLEMRRQPDRGAVDNFPLWKLGGLIMILGVGIIALIHCGIFGCSIQTRNAYITALIVTALVTLGC